MHKKKTDLQYSIQTIFKQLFAEADELYKNKKIHDQLSYSYVCMMRYVFQDTFKYSQNKYDSLKKEIGAYDDFCRECNISFNIFGVNKTISLKVFLTLIWLRNPFLLWAYYKIRFFCIWLKYGDLI